MSLPILSSQPRQLALSLGSRAGQQVRMAGKQAAPQQKAAQSIGGVKKGRKEKWETKIKQEVLHRAKDIPRFTRMSVDKLSIPKTKDRAAILPEVFQAAAAPSALKGLPLFEPKALVPRNIGQAASFKTSPTNAAKAFGLPNKMFLEYRILSSPCSVIRDITLDTVKTLDAAKDTPSSASRLVLHGTAGSGKSHLLHQLVQHAQSEDWIVIYIPRASLLVNSTTSYAYDPATQIYTQHRAAARLLSKILTANASLLDALPLTREVVINDKTTLSPGEGVTLKTLCEVSGKDKTFAGAQGVLEALVGELEKQDKFPVMMGVDDYQSLFGMSAYRDPRFDAVPAWGLGIVRMILELGSGVRSFAKGAFVSALTSSSTAHPVPIELRDALALPRRHPTSPYEKRDAVLEGYARGLKGIEVPARMSREECAGLFGVWKQDGSLTSEKYDELFLSKYVESGGNPRDFVWKGLLSTFST